MRDLYQVLGVPNSANEAEIKKAYRNLAKKLHPDTNRGDEKVAERFKQVSAAHAILSDKGKRLKYDRGHIDSEGNDIHRGFSGAHPGSGAGHGGFNQFNFGGARPEDIFKDLFGGMAGAGGPRRTRESPRRGSDRSYRLSITFLEAVQGTTKRLTLKNGKTLDVKISAGVEPGQQIRLKQQGDQGSAGAPPGDALVEICIEVHPYFQREGNDIHLDLPITLGEAVLGGKVKVPTVHGMVTVTVPKGSNTGQSMRLKGKGINPEGNAKGTGDQYLKLQVKLPDEIDNEMMKFIIEWSAENDYDVRDILRLI